MDDPFAVSRLQPVGHLYRQIQNLVHVQTLALHSIPQCLPFEELQGDEALALVLIDIVDGADVGMIEG